MASISPLKTKNISFYGVLIIFWRFVGEDRWVSGGCQGGVEVIVCDQNRCESLQINAILPARVGKTKWWVDRFLAICK